MPASSAPAASVTSMMSRRVSSRLARMGVASRHRPTIAMRLAAILDDRQVLLDDARDTEWRRRRPRWHRRRRSAPRRASRPGQPLRQPRPRRAGPTAARSSLAMTRPSGLRISMRTMPPSPMRCTELAGERRGSPGARTVLVDVTRQQLVVHEEPDQRGVIRHDAVQAGAREVRRYERGQGARSDADEHEDDPEHEREQHGAAARGPTCRLSDPHGRWTIRTRVPGFDRKNGASVGGARTHRPAPGRGRAPGMGPHPYVGPPLLSRPDASPDTPPSGVRPRPAADTSPPRAWSRRWPDACAAAATPRPRPAVACPPRAGPIRWPCG